MRRTAVLAACVALAPLLAACGSAERATAPPATRIGPEVAAERDPQTLLNRVSIPPRAELAPQLATGTLGGSIGALAVGAHRVYRIPQPYDTVLRFFERQHPRGAVSRSGMLVGLVRVTGRNRQLTWTFRPIRPFLSSRSLNVTVLALSPHSTGVRIEVDDIWKVRPASERVPPGTRTITIARVRWQTIAPLSGRITEPGKVAQVVRRFDALPLYKLSTVMYHCPLSLYRPPILVTFLSRTGRPLAQATVYEDGMGRPCDGGIAVTVRGRPQPMLAGAFLEPVLALAGLPRDQRF